MSTGALSARGVRVWVSPPTIADLEPYAQAVRRSAPRLLPFAVPDPDGLALALPRQGGDYRTFLLRAVDPEGEHGLVGRVNVSTIVHGAYRGATLGYDAYDPYAGRGLFAEGLRIVLAICFTPGPDGLGLHRLEANVQPANTRSAGVLRRLGFVHEGYSPDYLWLPQHADPTQLAWQDHDRYALLADRWIGSSYPPPARPRLVVLVAGQGSLAAALASELGVPALRHTRLGDAVWPALADSPVGAVVELGPSGQRETADDVEAGLRGALLTPDSVPVVADDGRAWSAREVTRLGLQVRAAWAR